eukprot:Hpha_TRINITY_DN8927_c0_g1::TRINITY_DN8927_c0_g1_i1::g.80926::m.80926
MKSQRFVFRCATQRRWQTARVTIEGWTRSVHSTVGPERRWKNDKGTEILEQIYFEGREEKFRYLVYEESTKRWQESPEVVATCPIHKFDTHLRPIFLPVPKEAGGGYRNLGYKVEPTGELWRWVVTTTKDADGTPRDSSYFMKEGTKETAWFPPEPAPPAAEPQLTEAPKTEAPKTEAPKTEAPKAESPKAEPEEAAESPLLGGKARLSGDDGLAGVADDLSGFLMEEGEDPTAVEVPESEPVSASAAEPAQEVAPKAEPAPEEVAPTAEPAPEEVAPKATSSDERPPRPVVQTSEPEPVPQSTPEERRVPPPDPRLAKEAAAAEPEAPPEPVPSPVPAVVRRDLPVRRVVYPVPSATAGQFGNVVHFAAGSGLAHVGGFEGLATEQMRLQVSSGESVRLAAELQRVRRLFDRATHIDGSHASDAVLDAQRDLIPLFRHAVALAGETSSFAQIGKRLREIQGLIEPAVRSSKRALELSHEISILSRDTERDKMDRVQKGRDEEERNLTRTRKTVIGVLSEEIKNLQAVGAETLSNDALVTRVELMELTYDPLGGIPPLFSPRQTRGYLKRHARKWAELRLAADRSDAPEAIRREWMAEGGVDQMVVDSYTQLQRAMGDNRAQGIEATEAVRERTAAARLFARLAAGVYNEHLFWTSLRPAGSAEGHEEDWGYPGTTLAKKAITAVWGSLSEFQSEFRLAAESLVGSGWVFLVFDDTNYAALKRQEQASNLLLQQHVGGKDKDAVEGGSETVLLSAGTEGKEAEGATAEGA